MAALKNHTALVTGANGFVAGHLIKLLLEEGYNVRGTVRSEAAADKLRATFSQYEPQLSFAIVRDITKAEEYDGALDGVTSVFHTASPFLLSVTDLTKELLEPALHGSTAILEAAAKAPSVKHVINTSSCAAVLDVLKGLRPDYNYTEKDWNPTTWDEAANSNPVLAYCASKGFAEKAMWDFMEEKKPGFVLTSLDPSWVFGPHVSAPASLEKLNESSAVMWSFVGATQLHNFDFGGYVDVRTYAKANLLALEKPELSAGERFIVSISFDWQQTADIIHAEIPELANRVPAGPGVPIDHYTFDGSKISKVLGLEYIPLNQTLKDIYSQLLEVEKATAVSA